MFSLPVSLAGAGSAVVCHSFWADLLLRCFPGLANIWKICYCTARFTCLCFLLQVLAQPLYATIEDLLLHCLPGLAVG
jgi:hypothetical protein